MRNEMQPGTGVRTIGGMYATVKEVNDDTVLLEVGPRRRTLLFAKNAIGAVLDDDEYNRIVHGIEHDLKSDDAVVPDDASSLTETDEPADDAAAASDDKPVDLGKKDDGRRRRRRAPRRRRGRGSRGEGRRRAEEDRRRLRREVVALRDARAERPRGPGSCASRTGVPTPRRGRPPR